MQKGGKGRESTGKRKALRQDIPMVERGSKKRDEERERAFLTPKLAFPPWKSPLGANRAIQGKTVDHRLRIYLSVLLSSFPHSPYLSACPPSISCRRTFLFHPRHITLHLRPVLRCLSIRVGFRVSGNLSISGVSALS